MNYYFYDFGFVINSNHVRVKWFSSGTSSLIWKWGRRRLADWTAGRPIRFGLMMMGVATHTTAASRGSWLKSAGGKWPPEPTRGPGLIQHSAPHGPFTSVCSGEHLVCVCVSGILLLLQRGCTSSVLRIRKHKQIWVRNNFESTF